MGQRKARCQEHSPDLFGWFVGTQSLEPPLLLLMVHITRKLESKTGIRASNPNQSILMEDMSISRPVAQQGISWVSCLSRVLRGYGDTHRRQQTLQVQRHKGEKTHSLVCILKCFCHLIYLQHLSTSTAAHRVWPILSGIIQTTTLVNDHFCLSLWTEWSLLSYSLNVVRARLLAHSSVSFAWPDTNWIDNKITKRRQLDKEIVGEKIRKELFRKAALVEAKLLDLAISMRYLEGLISHVSISCSGLGLHRIKVKSCVLQRKADRNRLVGKWLYKPL